MFIRATIAGVGTLFFSAAALACPDPSLMGAETMEFSSDDVWAEQTIKVTAGGNIDLDECLDLPGTGNVIEKPDFTFQYNRSKPYNVRFSADATCDTILLINDADGLWHWDDDSGDGEDPSISLGNASDGIIDVWVGTYEGQSCPAQLNIEAFNQ